MMPESKREAPWSAAVKLPLSGSELAYGAFVILIAGNGAPKFPKRELCSRTPRLACCEQRKSG